MRQQEPGLDGLLSPLELIKDCNRLRPLDLIKQFPGEPCAASDRWRWVGLETLHFRDQPPTGRSSPP
jgi:hypothetical protein